jgi:hypothetical protein
MSSKKYCEERMLMKEGKWLEILQLAPESVLCTLKNLKKKEVRILGRAIGKDVEAVQ